MEHAYQLTGLQFIFGFAGFVLVKVLEKGLDWWKEWLADRRDERFENARNAVEAGKTSFLSRIAISHEVMSHEISVMNGKLELQEKKGDIRHEQNLDKFESVCKFK